MTDATYINAANVTLLVLPGYIFLVVNGGNEDMVSSILAVHAQEGDETNNTDAGDYSSSSPS